ncbi:hypothetical protein [Pseudoalteromonas phenolica]|nr:hypothetical protein [Pseudoalteromonas phenolica]
MSRKIGQTEVKYRKWIKVSLRSTYQDYSAWLTVNDLPSEGHEHRVFG